MFAHWLFRVTNEAARSPKALALAHFDRIQAPKKAFLTIENAGHFAAMEKPLEFLDALNNTARPAIDQGPATDSAPRP